LLPIFYRTVEFAMSSKLRPEIAVEEYLWFVYDIFRTNEVRFLLTALGMTIGTSALILVVTIALAGREYVTKQIDGIGVNWIYAEYQAGAQGITNVFPDLLTIDDMKAVLQEVPGVVAASPVVPLQDRIPVGGGQDRDIQVLGVYPDYERVRNLVILSGRFFDQQDLQSRNKVGVITDKLAEQLYGSDASPIGKVIKLSGLPFTVIGTFRERVNTFGRSELTPDTIVIPHTVSRFFIATDSVKQLYFSVVDSTVVIPATEQIKRVLQSRHRPESVYEVDNLTQLLSVAGQTTRALTIVLLLIATVTLVVSGTGIMNIMLATVSARTQEIGIRKALGATNRTIRLQFLAEAMVISLVGGITGVIIGLGLPFSLRFFTDYTIPISGLSAIIAIGSSCLVGVLFGTLPATRAAHLDPVDSLRYE
jgi:putative ABC transport system permease protein